MGLGFLVWEPATWAMGRAAWLSEDVRNTEDVVGNSEYSADNYQVAELRGIGQHTGLIHECRASSDLQRHRKV